MASMRKISAKRMIWQQMYKVMLIAFTPRQCVRCSVKGIGWLHKDYSDEVEGQRKGDFQPHHIYRR